MGILQVWLGCFGTTCLDVAKKLFRKVVHYAFKFSLAPGKTPSHPELLS